MMKDIDNMYEVLMYEVLISKFINSIIKKLNFKKKL
jgi:hypothetical protein